MRVRSDSRDVNLARTQMDEEKDVVRDQAKAGPHFRGEEISGYQNVHVSANKLPTSRFLLPLGNRW